MATKPIPLALAVVGGSPIRHYEPNYVEISSARDVTPFYRGREIITTAKGNSFPKPKYRRK